MSYFGKHRKFHEALKKKLIIEDESISDEDAIIWGALMEARYKTSKSLLEILEELKSDIIAEIIDKRNNLCLIKPS